MLQVWLPLDGNLENKGLANITVTNNGATVDNNGKIGKCYSFNGSSQYIDFSSYASLLRGLSEVSICFWCYISNASSDKLFCIRDNNGGRHQLSLNSNEFSFRDTSNAGGNLRVISNTITVNTWTHIAICYKSGSLYIYKNGELSNSYISSSLYQLNSGISDFFIGRNVASSGTTYLNGKLNDFRIYNHTLSPKEVKEISKGLILHYKLDGNDIGITIPRNGGLIPDGVELYDYILSSGTQYIDTGYVPNDTSGIYLRAYCTTSGGNHLIIGCRQTSGDTRWWINYSTTLELSWNLWTSTLTGYTNTWTEVEHNYMNSRSAKVNGTAYSVSYPTLANITYSAYLFNSCNQGNVGGGFTGRISNVKITEGATIVRNFLPCTYLGEPGMWDTVKNKFYRNQGTGLFTLGSKITLKEYEYLLDATGTYINTGINVTQTSGFDLKMSFSATPTAEHIFFGSRAAVGYQGNNNYCLESKATGRLVFVGPYSGSVYSNTGNSNTLVTANTPYLLQYNNGNFTIDNNSQEMIGTILNINYPIYIFVANAGGNYDSSYTHKVTNKLYYCKLYENNQLVRDFIPVSYNGTPGLWDKVEWKFYANAGTGSFTLGPEIAVQQDAPIFYDSSGYCNHGSITGTLTTNNDSPRYTYSTGFTGTQYIHLTPPTTEVKTISLWAKWNSIPSGQSIILVDYGSQMGLGLMSTGILCSTSNAGNSYTFPKSGIVANTWYHFVIVKTGTTARDLYINGVKQTQTSSTSTWSYFANELQLGKRSSTSDGFNGKLSDFRAYATTLSEDDIKELYNTSAFVTNNGVFAEYELYEDNLSDVKKTGLLETANFYENGAESGYALDTDKTRVASNYIISEEFIEI